MNGPRRTSPPGYRSSRRTPEKPVKQQRAPRRGEAKRKPLLKVSDGSMCKYLGPRPTPRNAADTSNNVPGDLVMRIKSH